MATILLSAAGAAIGSGFGGSVLGLSGAVIGRAIGATAGRSIDQRLLGGGGDPVETGKVERFRIAGASEGAAIAQLWGRVRVAGQVIWATRFLENAEATGGGKGNAQGSGTSFSYSISLALALCTGAARTIGRIWADGIEQSPASFNLRFYPGDETQLPDPKIEVVEGVGQAPAFRGIAYVIIEDLDLSRFGNRVPQFSFEVIRPAQGDLAESYGDVASVLTAVALIPGTGEYALATTPVYFEDAPGVVRNVNTSTLSGQTDMELSLEHLTTEMPSVEAVSLIVSWFGSDLRCGNCTIRPKVEQSLEDAVGMNWSVSGLVRASAATVPLLSGSPVYGGTPTDASVVEGILALKNSGKAVMFYPFILMDQMEGNALPDPWSGAVGQPALPWRGRITASLAPGMDGSPDTTAAAAIEVATFFGLAQASDFVISGSTVSYTGAQDWGYRRFILHCAHLCVAAGGVDAFCIGSEMRGLTQIRGAAHSFPAVDALRMLAADVRAILGPLTKITYAADWSEYFGCHTGDNVYFHLDSLWAHPAIDCIGIDNYMPLADWRDGEFHADAAFGSIYNLDYLMANVAGGEGFDWYYDGPEGEAAQLRKSIVDGAYGEPWVFRYKDLKSWWQNQHFQRINGVRSATPTDWVQQSKPFWFTEFGCAAIDKGANQPNLFLDPKSSESCLPRGSNGQRDDLMQAQYLRAISEFWADPANNPTSTSYAGKMLDTSRLFAWAWDARPYPAFPALSDKWSDGNNYLRGHWLNGRSSNQLLAGVVAEICVESGVVDLDLSQINGIVRGYSIAQIGTARSALQPLTLAHALDGFERDGLLKFAARTSFGAELIDSDEVAIAPSLDGSIVFNRQSEAEIIGRLRLGFVQADGDFAVRTIEATLPNDGSEVTSTSELPLMLTSAEAVTIAERWLSESQAARDSLRLALPPSMQPIGVGDVVSVQDKTYRIDSVETSEIQLLGATRIHGALYASGSEISDPATYAVISAPTPVYPVFMDLPLLTGDERPHAAHVSIVAKPWLGPAAIWSSSSDAGYSRVALADRSATFGLTLTALAAETTGLWARGPGLRVKLSSGALSSASSAEVLAGANTAFIGDSTDDNWEVFQFQTAELVAPQTYDLRLRLRGQAGTNGIMPALWPQGSRFVLFNSALQQLDLAGSTRGISRHYRAGLAAPGYSDTRVVHQEHVFSGIGYRPYSVAHLAVQGQLGSTIDVGWIRRTRIDGDPWSAIDVPLGEEQERYLVRVLQASAILRETAVSAAGWSYSSSQQSADGAGPAAVIEVAQISSRFGPGPFVSVAI